MCPQHPLFVFFSGIAHYIPQYDARYMKSSPGSISERNLDGQILSTTTIMNMWWLGGQYQCTWCGANQKLTQFCPAWIHSFCKLDKPTTSWDIKNKLLHIVIHNLSSHVAINQVCCWEVYSLDKLI